MDGTVVFLLLISSLPFLIGLYNLFNDSEKAYEEVMEEAEPAFDHELDIQQLRRKPGRLKELAPLIDAVHLQRLQAPPNWYSRNVERRNVNDQDKDWFSGFVIDANGETHTVSEGFDREIVRQETAWLADQIDLPLKDETALH